MHSVAAPPVRRRWWAAAVVLLLIAAACVTVGLRGHQTGLAAPIASQFTPPSVAGSSPTTAAATGVTVPAPPPAAPAVLAAPVSLRVPAIDVSVSLSKLGLNPDGTVQVPTDFQEPGWFRLGPSPGEVGSAVILGHVDSYQGPAVFFRIGSLQAGDRVEVNLADGAVAHFKVDTVATYLKDQFPAEQVYASKGFAALQLVTCGGEFDYDTRHYLSNVVAYTRLVSITPAGG